MRTVSHVIRNVCLQLAQKEERLARAKRARELVLEQLSYERVGKKYKARLVALRQRQARITSVASGSRPPQTLAKSISHLAGERGDWFSVPQR